MWLPSINMQTMHNIYASGIEDGFGSSYFIVAIYTDSTLFFVTLPSSDSSSESYNSL